MELFLECALFVVGLAFGSFLNVCIARIPRDQSIVSPPSHCPRCHKPISWRDNLPLLSWIVLRGRCRDCGEHISLRYPVVELLTAALFVACYGSFGATWFTLKFCVFCFLIVGLIFMDGETGLLPREFTYLGIAIGLATAWFGSIDASGTSFLLSEIGARSSSNSELYFLDSVLGAVFGGGFFYLAWALYYLLRRRHGVGFGDIALIAMVGAFLGLKLTVLVVFLSPNMATVFALTMLRLSRKANLEPALVQTNSDAQGARSFLLTEVPFGVFLGGSSLIALFLGRQIWGWYLGLFR